ncbi:meiotic recombination protein REC8 homolog [Elysia marginata]|uniref:Meiotic recombination protein REC8 homolog n=1 Tax=Elysia marginata TaxID=1093978 RepID=A0AAV4HD00_9GAST|nr:meiotic recombination protein REC8 homolog [Elysia marginata]
MFYSHVHLRKNGRFGLVWLAATQSRLLSRRELAAINVSMTVTNIQEHFPGSVVQDVNNRPRRFSLYLSSQLMYGSVKVLQKQWEFLLGDLTALLKRFHPESSSTTEIDLIIARQEPVTLESCVPSSIKDKCYDPFFGVFKENIADVQALLATWDDEYIRKEPLAPDQFKAELGSPHSVSDLRQIQILDHPDTSGSIQIPDEQDLPYINPEHLAFIEAADQQVNISAEDLITPAISRILENQDISQVFGTEITEQQTNQAPRSIEETPAVKTTRELPSTPKKPKRRQRDDGDGGRKKPRNLDAEEKGSSDDARSGYDQQKARDAEGLSPQQILQQEHTQHQRADSPKSPQKQADKQQLVSPEIARRQENWLQMTSNLQLTPIPSTPSPVRKRQPHKLIIDEKLQMTRLDLKNNMNSSTDTCNTLVLPSAQKKDLFKEPGSQAISHLAVRKMWTKNCRFGLRVSEPDIETFGTLDISPLETPRTKRKESTVEYETPAKFPRVDSMVLSSGPGSMEKGRDISDISGINESRKRSTSLIGQASDDSVSNISADQPHISAHSELERNSMDITLAPLIEEQEQVVSPVPLEISAQLQTMNVSNQPQSVPLNTTDDKQSRLLRLVLEKADGTGNWTTFRTICPPNTTSRPIAISLFQELCLLVGEGVLQVRQDKPYSDIFIWEADENSSC